MHDTHPVFNPVSPTTHSLNASVARGDTKSLPGLNSVSLGGYRNLTAAAVITTA